MIKYYCLGLVSDFFAGKLHSKWEGPHVIEEVYCSGAIEISNLKGTNPQVVNGQRLKHYLSGDPYDVESNVIQVITMEEHIKIKYRSTPQSKLE